MGVCPVLTGFSTEIFQQELNVLKRRSPGMKLMRNARFMEKKWLIMRKNAPQTMTDTGLASRETLNTKRLLSLNVCHTL